MRKHILLIAITFASTLAAFAQQVVIMDTVYANIDRCFLYADGDFWFRRNIHDDIVPCMKRDDGKTFLYCADVDTAKFKYEYNFSQCSRLVVIRKKHVSYVDFVPQPDYMDTLRTGKTFDVSQQRDIPTFTYQSADAPELQVLRLNSEQLGKWLWIDPTNEAYVMDENQQLFSVFEVRERIIQDKPIELNAEANWNNQSKVSKEYYLDYYMAKNLFYLSYILHSTYGADSRTPESTVEFLTLKPKEVEQGVPVEETQSDNVTIREYFTNNPDLLR